MQLEELREAREPLERISEAAKVPLSIKVNTHAERGLEACHRTCQSPCAEEHFRQLKLAC